MVQAGQLLEELLLGVHLTIMTLIWILYLFSRWWKVQSVKKNNTECMYVCM